MLKILSVMVLWLPTIYIILYIEPFLLQDIGVAGLYLPLLISLSMSILYTFATLTKSIITGLLVTLPMMGIIVLSLVKVLTVYNGVATIIFFGFIIYQRSRNATSKKSNE